MTRTCSFQFQHLWYVIHLTAPGLNVQGFALPGAPLVIIGHNDRIAWGFTNSNVDVEDLYIESFDASQSACSITRMESCSPPKSAMKRSTCAANPTWISM